MGGWRWLLSDQIPNFGRAHHVHAMYMRACTWRVHGARAAPEAPFLGFSPAQSRGQSRGKHEKMVDFSLDVPHSPAQSLDILELIHMCARARAHAQETERYTQRNGKCRGTVRDCCSATVAGTRRQFRYFQER
jgi:hypothetical protein